MKGWERARVAVTCGGLHDDMTRIAAGEPVYVITVAGRRHYRCERCAGEAAPALPVLVPPVDRIPEVMARLTRAALEAVIR